MRLIDADALGIGKAKRDAFLIPEYADGWNSAVEHIENAPTVDIKTEVAREIFAEIKERISSLEYKAKTQRKIIRVEELKDQVNWVLHEVISNTITELENKYTKEGVGE